MARNCPQCHTLMETETVDNVSVDVCPKCAGIWFAEVDLRNMLKNSPSALQDLEESAPKIEQKTMGQSELRCPDDGAILNFHHYLYSSPAVLHTCPKCYGFFIAADQLAKMHMALSSAHSPDKDAEVIGQYAGENAKYMMRQRAIQDLCKTLSQFSPGWFA